MEEDAEVIATQRAELQANMLAQWPMGPTTPIFFRRGHPGSAVFSLFFIHALTVSAWHICNGYGIVKKIQKVLDSRRFLPHGFQLSNHSIHLLFAVLLIYYIAIVHSTGMYSLSMFILLGFTPSTFTSRKTRDSCA